MLRTAHILYITARYPALSETFVWREIQEVRSRGHTVTVIRLRPPTTDAENCVAPATPGGGVVDGYGLGPLALISDVFKAFAQRPLRCLYALAMSLSMAGLQPDLRNRERLLQPLQALLAIALSSRLPARRPTHIHAHMANTPTTVAMYLAAVMNTTFSFTGHANDLFVHRVMLPAKLRRCGFAASITSWHQRWYSHLSGRDNACFPIVRCGVDIPPPSRPADRRRRFTVCFVGRLVPKKGVDTLVAAIDILRSQGADCICHIIGDGPQMDALRHLIRSLALEDRVELHGAKDHQSALQCIAASDAFALPCRTDRHGDREGLPVALMEAMAAGKPVVCSPFPGLEDLVIHERTGLLVPSDSPKLLADAIKRFASDAALASRLGAAAKEAVSSEFSTDINIDRLLNAFGLAPAPRPLQVISRIARRPVESVS